MRSKQTHFGGRRKSGGRGKILICHHKARRQSSYTVLSRTPLHMGKTKNHDREKSSGVKCHIPINATKGLRHRWPKENALMMRMGQTLSYSEYSTLYQVLIRVSCLLIFFFRHFDVIHSVQWQFMYTYNVKGLVSFDRFQKFQHITHPLALVLPIRLCRWVAR
jgi:hypothetical protein